MSIRLYIVWNWFIAKKKNLIDKLGLGLLKMTSNQTDDSRLEKWKACEIYKRMCGMSEKHVLVKECLQMDKK